MSPDKLRVSSFPDRFETLTFRLRVRRSTTDVSRLPTSFLPTYISMARPKTRVDVWVCVCVCVCVYVCVCAHMHGLLIQRSRLDPNQSTASMQLRQLGVTETTHASAGQNRWVIAELPTHLKFQIMYQTYHCYSHRVAVFLRTLEGTACVTFGWAFVSIYCNIALGGIMQYCSHSFSMDQYTGRCFACYTKHITF